MDRREFVALGVGGALGAGATQQIPQRAGVSTQQDSHRALFPRLAQETFLDAAGGTPLATFAEAGLQRYMEFQKLGVHSEYVSGVLGNIHRSFGKLIGAQPHEIALVHCTKAGEQIVLDGLDPMRHGRNVVTNDMHFTGSLHNLIGLRRAGMDVRIVRSRDWDVPLENMESVIDERTALVALTLVSNVTGRIEPMRELAQLAHDRGALVYADIIQAAGIMPVDVRALGIDFAACSGYKWLYGVHGVGFLYVRAELQGSVLPDRLFPGHVEYNYRPWVDRVDPAEEPLLYQPPVDATRYQPGHVSYLGYCALYEGLEFIHRIGVDTALAHSIRLNQRLRGGLDPNRYRSISRHLDRSPIATFLTADPESIVSRLQNTKIKVALHGNRLRISPALYNTAADIDLLIKTLNRPG